MVAEKSRLRGKEAVEGISFVIPVIIIMTVFTLLPVFYSLYLSLNKVSLIGNATYQFVGLKNYLNVFQDDRFWTALGNTFRYVIIVAPVQTAISLILASLLNSGIKFQNTFRTVFFLPTLTSSSALTMIFMFLFSLTGPINNVLLDLGILSQPINFMNDTQFVLGTIMVMNIWATVPFFMTIYLAGLQDIPRTMYEAAEIDGANAWNRLIKITVPQLAPITNFVLLMGIIGCFQLFDQAYIISNGTGGPDNATLTLSLIVYQYAFKSFNTMGYASAIAIIMTIIIFIASLLERKINREDLS